MSYSGEKIIRERLCNGESMAIASPNAKNHNSIEFIANVSSFDGTSKLVISHGKVNPWCSAYVIIDSKTVSVYEFFFEERLLETVSHNLTISDFIKVSIDVGAGFYARLVIETASGSFSKDICWNGSNSDILAESFDATFSDCTLSYYIGGVHKGIWLFGDSYFDTWGKNIVEWGYSDFYFDAYSGRWSGPAIDSLVKNMSYATPKKIVWLMGMNDPDGDSVNPAWMECYGKLSDICRENNIELILSTTPNTPSRNNRYKNEIVRNSGYRYIDVSDAVGADIDSGWADGLIDADGVHPSPQGAKIIAECVLSALPEIK